MKTAPGNGLLTALKRKKNAVKKKTKTITNVKLNFA